LLYTNYYTNAEVTGSDMSRLGIEPELSLAFSVHSGPGTYAILLGSGVSRAAGVPTGWEVTLDLVRKLAKLQGDATDNPEAWYIERFGREPSYSEVVNELAPTQDERRSLLQGYFEPDEEDRAEGRKEPTAAHRAIARLCSKGYVRVIVTTNFDRLLERALEAEGVAPIVIDTPDAAEGAPPLQHSACTVVKVNGDYLDTRIKNTPEELGEYDDRIKVLLGRIFQEYGLVVCGWSGTYDTALIDALRRAGGRRYMAYWVSRGAPSEEERSLTSFIGGTSIESEGANEFFADVLDKVEALETFGGNDPLSTSVAVATAKRYLDDLEGYVRLRELVSSVGREAREKVFDEERFPVDWSLSGGTLADQHAALAEEIRRRIVSYEKACETAVGVMAAGGYYARERQVRAFGDLLELAGSPPTPNRSYSILAVNDLLIYPALLLLYAGGVAATATGNWPFLRTLLRDSMFTDRYQKTRPIALSVYPWAIGNQENINRAFFSDGHKHEPTSQRLFEIMQAPLEDYLPLEFRYREAFYRFEVLLSLTYVNINGERERSPREWAPLGHFAYLHKRVDSEESALRTLSAEYVEQGTRWAPIESGLLKQAATSDGSVEDVLQTVGRNFEVIDAMIQRKDYF
jgi:SIR2-like domain